MGSSDDIDMGEKLNYDQAWCGYETDRKCRDLPFIILFLLVVIAFGIAGVYGLSKADLDLMKHMETISEHAKTDADHFKDARSFFDKGINHLRENEWTLAGCCLGAILMGLIWLQLIRYFTKPIVYLSIFLGVLGVAALGVVLVIVAGEKDELYLRIAGFVVIGIAVLLAVLVFFLRKRIDFTCMMIEEACSGLSHNLTLIFAVAPSVLILYAGFVCFWVVSVVAVFSIPKNHCPKEQAQTLEDFKGLLAEHPECEVMTEDGPKYLLIFFMFVLFWVSFWMQAVLQSTTAGTISQWYFGRNGLSTSGIPSLTAFKHSMTYSSGSLAAGSLILAIIALIRWIIKQAEKEAGGNPILRLVLCCVSCICACLQSIVAYLTRYAYIYVAMHGTSFLQSAKKTGQLFGRSGLERVFADMLTDWVLYLANLLCTGSLVCILILVMQAKGDGEIDILSVVVGGVICFSFFHLIAVTVRVGADTVFVCYLEDMERNSDSRNFAVGPELHEAIQERSSKMSA